MTAKTTAFLLPALLACLSCGVQEPRPPAPPELPFSTVPLAAGCSYADPLTLRAPRDFVRGWPALCGEGLVHAVVEIPAGTVEKWEVGLDGTMRWDIQDGRPRRVKFLGYPCNYGIVPGALLGKEIGGDGDPLDMLVLGPALPRGTVLPVKLLGAIRLIDGGAQDDKLIAVPADSPLAEVSDLAGLDARFPGVTAILRTWFENYKGPGALSCPGFASRGEALALLESARESFGALGTAEPGRDR